MALPAYSARKRNSLNARARTRRPCDMGWLVRLLGILKDELERLLNPGRFMFNFNSFINSAQYQNAKRISEQTGTPIDRVLIQLNFAGEREEQMARALERGMAFADLERIVLDPAALALVSPNLLREIQAIPVKLSGNILWLATSEHGTTRACHAVHEATGLKVIPVLAVSHQIEQALSRLNA